MKEKKIINISSLLCQSQIHNGSVGGVSVVFVDGASSRAFPQKLIGKRRR